MGEKGIWLPHTAVFWLLSAGATQKLSYYRQQYVSEAIHPCQSDPPMLDDGDNYSPIGLGHIHCPAADNTLSAAH